MKPMKGKRVVITGPTSGIGKEVTLQLADMGAELILACRDIAKGKKTAQEIEARTGSSNVVVMHFDASSQRSVRAFAREFLHRYRRLDVLINNAGGNRGTLPRLNGPDGIELTFATNVLAYFLLTQELLPVLKKSAPSRIVIVASTFASDLDLDDLQFERRPFESFKAYAQSKACNRMLTWAFARRLAGSGVEINAMAPGLIVDTGLYRNAPAELVTRLRQYGAGRTIADGADTVVWLASSPEVKGVSGKFFYDRKVVACEFRNKKKEEQLWSICEEFIKPAGSK